MIKIDFKVGDKARIVTLDEADKSCGFEVGDIVTIDEYDDAPYCNTKKGRHVFRQSQLELVPEDRSTWHTHHDVIVAWAKGAKVQSRPADHSEQWCDVLHPDFDLLMYEWRVKPEPDNTAELAEIEQEMRKLADRLENLKQ